MILRSVQGWLIGALLLTSAAMAGTDTVVILHTNDIHDHIRPGYDGVGGMPYISSYIRSVKEQRSDTLILDAGDVMEKGDMVAFKTEGMMMYEAMGRIGYQAGTAGNHDYDHGFARLCQCIAPVSGFSLICANWPAATGSCLVASRVFYVDGVNVGVIGLMKPQEDGIKKKELAEILSQEADRLEPQVQLIVAVCHLGSEDCESISKRVPSVDVFVSGHTHEILNAPKTVPETGALIVQAGQYARYVGRLELTIDMETEKVLQSKGELVEMRHDTIPCDAGMLAWIQQQEQSICPEATQKVAHLDAIAGSADIARWAAAGIREKAGVDIGFCHPGVIIRSGLPKGDVDFNALFLTGGQRGYALIKTTLTGAQIERYLAMLASQGWGRTVVDGFTVEYGIGSAKTASIDTNLDPAKSYSIAMPELEWTSRFVRSCEKIQEQSGDNIPIPTTESCPFTFTDALAGYMTKPGFKP